MQWITVPDLESYEQREEWRGPEHRTAWPISSPPPGWERSCEPTLKPGDLIGWVRHPDADLEDGWYTPMWRNKHVGLVLMTRWVLADWDRFDKKEPKVFPEALVLWGDDETTNTSQSCLKVIG